MKKTLENLWYMYQMENRVPYDAQEEQVIDQLVAAEKMLHEQLSEVQKAALKNMKISWTRLAAFAKNAHSSRVSALQPNLCWRFYTCSSFLKNILSL